jgi:hypothetical protein
MLIPWNIYTYSMTTIQCLFVFCFRKLIKSENDRNFRYFTKSGACLVPKYMLNENDFTVENFEN